VSPAGETAHQFGYFGRRGLSIRLRFGARDASERPVPLTRRGRRRSRDFSFRCSSRADHCSRADHRQFVRWCANTAEELGLARVTGQDVLTVLVRTLLTDDMLADQVKVQLSDDNTA
jgi:hypothetical protein